MCLHNGNLEPHKEQAARRLRATGAGQGHLPALSGRSEPGVRWDSLSNRGWPNPGPILKSWQCKGEDEIHCRKLAVDSGAVKAVAQLGVEGVTSELNSQGKGGHFRQREEQTRTQSYEMCVCARVSRLPLCSSGSGRRLALSITIIFSLRKSFRNCPRSLSPRHQTSRAWDSELHEPSQEMQRPRCCISKLDL